MREIQQAGKVIAQIIAKVLMLRQGGQVSEALRLIDEAGEMLLDIDFDDGKVFTYQKVVNRLTDDREADLELMSALAEMLRHQGELHVLREDWAEAHHSLQLALRLELKLEGTHRHAFPATEDPVDAILRQLDLHAIDHDLFRPLVMHYERTGRFAEAEDVLFFWLEQRAPDISSELIDTGLAFYKRLRQHSSEELAAGNFSRKEVEDGERSFRQATAR